MKYKTAELEGALLDATVAKAEGKSFETVTYWIEGYTSVMVEGARFNPSTIWQHGGPIIERERISLVRGELDEWHAFTGKPSTVATGEGEHRSSPLIAAMRAFVFSKYGQEVELS